MKIAVIGSGGVGGYFGGKLAKFGFDVHFLARGIHFEVIEKEGLKVQSIQGDFHIEKVKIYQKIENMGQQDLLILAVKSWQVKELAPSLNKILHGESMVLPLQNGIMSSDELCNHIPPSSVLNGLCRIFSWVEAPGKIIHGGVEPLIVFGERNNELSERVKRLSEIFSKAGITNKIAQDIQSELWKKFISICLSGLMAISKTSYGEMRSIPEMRRMMFQLLEEVYTLGLEAGVKLDGDYIEKAVAFIDGFSFEATASLTRDVWAGRPSEIHYQNGTVVRLANELGLHVPLNKFVYHTILPMEMKARKKAGLQSY